MASQCKGRLVSGLLEMAMFPKEETSGDLCRLAISTHDVEEVEGTKVFIQEFS